MKKSRNITIFLLLFFGFAFITGTIYALSNFNFDSNPIAQIIFHILVPAEGTGSAFIKGILIQVVLIPLFGSLFVTYVINNKSTYFEYSILDKFKFAPFKFIKKHALVLSTVFFLISFIVCSFKLEIFGYFDNLFRSTTLYEDEYVDPKKFEYTFPEKKRNLIYIYLESVETSDYSKKQGGAFDENIIEELYELAQENITFNDNQGFYVLSDTGWTASSMIAQTSGINLSIPIDGNSYISESNFLNGAYSLGEILEQQGYTNELLIGSDAIFGGRKNYFTQHGNYLIHDYNWAIDEGLIPEDYYVWWGYEDHKLFEFAKNEVLKLASSNEPFNFTMLTVDTHHVGGYICDICENNFDFYSLANVLACTSRQTVEFVRWVQEQDFYENTTIVVVGDHCSMDTNWRNFMDEDYQRKVYYTFINPAPDLIPSSNRQLTTVDLYPTTLASLGVDWGSDKLGLGVNLFSNTETLVEKYGLEELNYIASKHSYYYDKYILYVDNE